MAYALAKTERIHVGSAIFNITRPVNHPARIAERVAMLDHLGEGRFEFGTGRGLVVAWRSSGSASTSMERTRELYDEALPQIVRMWKEDAVLLRGHGVLDAAAPRAPQALHRPAPADLGGGRLAGHLREGGPPRHRRAVLHARHARHVGPAHRDLQEEHREGRARRRLRQQQHHGHRRHDVPRGRRPRPAASSWPTAATTTPVSCSGTSTRSRAPTASRSGRSCRPTRRWRS